MSGCTASWAASVVRPLTTLVSTQQLADICEWRVFDCRHDLMKPDLGEQQYREAHIPGALFAHLERDLSAPQERQERPPSPARSRKTFMHGSERQGARVRSDQVVCYDAANGSHGGAAVVDAALDRPPQRSRCWTAASRNG